MSKTRWTRAESESVTVELPVEAAKRLRAIAKHRAMEPSDLARMYVGRGIREDLQRVFEEQALEVARDVVREMHSADEAEQVVARVRERLELG
jgi:hypothetical protein